MQEAASASISTLLDGNSRHNQVQTRALAHANVCFLRRYVALGGVDSLVSLWDLEELYCMRTFVVTAYVPTRNIISNETRLPTYSLC